MSEPPAEISLTADDVDRLIAAQHPALHARLRTASHAGPREPLTLVAHGWDNDVFRLGPDLAVRLPRRKAAARLVENEQRWLPLLAPRLPVAIPVPIALGRPGDGFPWPWSIVPWFVGRRGLDVEPAERDTVAEQLADALRALHVPAPSDAPVNPVRGVPMAARDDVVRERLASHPALLRTWVDGVDAPSWHGPPVWVHGDVHPGNLVLDGGRVAALLDFGDLTSGDPACDLAAAWLMFTPAGRSLFRARLGDRYDEATWRRARGWAAAMTMLVRDVDDVGFRRMAAHAEREIGRGP